MNFSDKNSGTHLRRFIEIEGRSVQINSGHGYNRVHATGDIRSSGYTMDQVDGAIVRDILSISDISAVPRIPRYESRVVDLGGYRVGYRVGVLSTGVISVTTYYPD